MRVSPSSTLDLSAVKALLHLTLVAFFSIRHVRIGPFYRALNDSLQLLGTSSLPRSQLWLPDLGTLAQVRHPKLGLCRDIPQASGGGAVFDVSRQGEQTLILISPAVEMPLLLVCPITACLTNPRLITVDGLPFTGFVSDNRSFASEFLWPSSVLLPRPASTVPLSSTSTTGPVVISCLPCCSRPACGTLLQVSDCGCCAMESILV